jgi:major membrane immunogen (membrane-anchored lipoprotein)
MEKRVIRKSARKMNMKIRGLILLMCATLSLCALFGCAKGTAQLQDGYYTAEFAQYDDHGWKEFLTIYVYGNRIVTAEYNAKNLSGFIKSWDMDYMRTMNATDGTYPNEYTRVYSEALLNGQTPDQVDAITGATTSHDSFQRLAQATIAQALKGDKNIVLLDQPPAEHEETED